MSRRGYCIFIDTAFQGAVPSVRGDNGKPFIFATEVEAQREIVDCLQVRLQEFLDRERDFEDAITVEEYVVEVEVWEDGSVIHPDGRMFGTGCA
jgi:hypothetical protein